MKKLLIFFLVSCCFAATGQNVGIGTNVPNASAQLDVSANNKGVLVPRLTNAQMIAIASPANGLLVYNTDSAAFAYRQATAWVFLKGGATASNNWSTTGNTGTNASANFIGTTDDVDLVFKRNGELAGVINSSAANTSFGVNALNPLSTGRDNTAIGWNALAANTTGLVNTAAGSVALASNTTGSANTAFGAEALFENTEGSFNTAAGAGALDSNKTGSFNTASGALSLIKNNSGSGNVANGYNSLVSNTTGNDNTAIGALALETNNNGNTNTALGNGAGYANISGSGNVFIGYHAGYDETASNKLYISNSGTDAANTLLYGDFANKIASIGGKLGVGTTAPENLLHVKNANTDANASQLIIEGNSDYGNSTTSAIEFRSNFTSSNSGISGRIKSYYTSNDYTDSRITFQNVTIGPALVDAMTLTNGRVGIGTTTPNGDLQFANTLVNRKIVLFEDANNDNQYYGMGVNNSVQRYQVAHTAASHVFYAGTGPASSNELMRLTGTGLLGLAKIPLTSNDDSRLQVKQTGLQNGIGVEAANSTNHWDFYATTTAASNFALYYNGALKGTFDNVTGAYTASSDIRLKKDITAHDPVLEKIMQLKAFQYHYTDNKPGDRFSNGFMAQDVQKIFPDAVIENTMKDGETRLGINYQYFTVLAIKAVQEQQKELDLLKQQMKAMMEEMEKLKKK